MKAHAVLLATVGLLGAATIGRLEACATSANVWSYSVS